MSIIKFILDLPRLILTKKLNKMKKVFTLVAIAAAFTFTACNEATEEATTTEEVTTEEVVEEEVVVEEEAPVMDSTAMEMDSTAVGTEEVVEEEHDHAEDEEHAH